MPTCLENSEYFVFALPNGLRCVHRRIPGPKRGQVSVAHMALTIGAGTRDEQEEQHGVAHLVEHLIFKGTARRSAWQVNSLLENAGGELNAFTTKEETVIHATLLKSEFGKGIDLLSDMAFNSTFTPKEIDKEREVILDEINSYKDSPAELIYDEFEELLFEGSALGRNILGDKRTLKRVGRNQLLAFCQRNYQADRIVFSASSAMTHARFRNFCEQHLSFIPAASCGVTRHKPDEKSVKQELIKHKATYQAHCLMGSYAYDLYHSKRMNLAFLVNLLGGPASVSRLNMQLREKHALTYSVEAGYTPYADTGLFTIYFGCEKDKLERSQELVYAELKKLRETALTTAQLARAKKLFLGQLAIASEHPENLMLSIAKSLLVYDSFDSTAEIAAKISGITSQQLQDVAQEVFAEPRIHTLIYR